MADDVLFKLVLFVIVGTLAAIVYSLRILVLLDKKIERIERHIESLAETLVRSRRKK